MVDRSVRHRIFSFRAALSGLGHALTHEVNLQLELAAAVVALGLGLWVRLSAGEWATLVLTIVLVLVLELVNTAFEHLADLSRPRLDPLVRVAKDVSAAAVLVASLGAIVVGVLLLAPRMLDLIHG